MKTLIIIAALMLLSACANQGASIAGQHPAYDYGNEQPTGTVNLGE